jgi:hypothetical protein
VRMADGRLAEHWDVIQDEATKEQSKSGRPMFGDRFPSSPPDPGFPMFDERFPFESP